MRWLGFGADPGDFELVQIGDGARRCSPSCRYCQARRGNIVVDTFTTWLPPRVQRGLDAFWDLVYAASWRSSPGA